MPHSGRPFLEATFMRVTFDEPIRKESSDEPIREGSNLDLIQSSSGSDLEKIGMEIGRKTEKQNSLGRGAKESR